MLHVHIEWYETETCLSVDLQVSLHMIVFVMQELFQHDILSILSC